MKLKVLRIGHRYSRDKRVTTHVALVARAFGADELVMDVKDKTVSESIDKINKEWGGEFRIGFIDSWKEYIKNFPGEKIHLTMYGININDTIEKIKSSGKDKLIIIGGKKVPSEMYHLADYNIAIGNQPHSEVSALAVFLDRLFEGRELDRKFNGRRTIVPHERGKNVEVIG